MVPTWNYVVVHAYGYLKIIEDGEWLMTHLASLTNIHEAGVACSLEDRGRSAGLHRIAAKGIVGLEMTIERLEGKWKVSQNRSEQDRTGVAKGLAELNTKESLEMKALVEKRD